MNSSGPRAARVATTLSLLALLWSAPMAPGCGSGGGISGTSLVSGPIDGFGSILVGGVTFDIDDAEIFIGGDPAAQSDLRLGMIASVRVRGRIDPVTMTGTAAIVATEHFLAGPVEAVNGGDGTFVSLSQLVITDASTVFDQATLQTLMVGDSVEVFGFVDADGSIRATRVERLGADPGIDLRGTVANLDLDAQTFNIGILTVDFSNAVIDQELAAKGLSDGLLVEVEADDPPVNDLFLAVGVEEHVPDLTAEIGDDVEVEGFVTRVVSADEFVLNGSQRVLVTEATTYEDGEVDDLVLNARVEASGRIDSSGALIAAEIEFE